MGDLKQCKICKETKPLSAFTKSHQKRKDGSYVAYSNCTSCDVLRLYEWRKQNPEKNKKHKRDARIKKEYGLTVAQYNQILQNQNGRCKICGSDVSDKRGHPLCVDHDHKSGTVRGLLCQACNKGIGSFRDNTKLLFRAVDYLNGTE